MTAEGDQNKIRSLVIVGNEGLTMVQEEAGARWRTLGKHAHVHTCGGSYDCHLFIGWCLLWGLRLLNQGDFRPGVRRARGLRRRGIKIDLRLKRFLLNSDDDTVVLLVNPISLVKILNRIVTEGNGIRGTNTLAVASGGESFGCHRVSGGNGQSADNGTIAAGVGVWPASGLCSDPSLVVYGLAGQRRVLVNEDEFGGHIDGCNRSASGSFIGRALLKNPGVADICYQGRVVLTCCNKAFTRKGYNNGKPIGGQRTAEILPLSINAPTTGGSGACGEENAGLLEKKVGMNDNAGRLDLFLLKSRVYLIKQSLYLARLLKRSGSEQPCCECLSPDFVGRLVLEERVRGLQSREASY